VVSKKTVILAVAIAVVVTVPAVAWAVGGPLEADPQPPTTTGNADPGAPYGWMGQMHDYMWNNGDLPEDFPADATDWMNQMHDHMWGDTPADGSYGWMGQMHDYMWNNRDLPEDLAADATDWMNQMHDFMWGSGRSSAQVDPAIGGSSSQSVPSGSNSQGAGSTRPGPGPGWAGAGCRVAGSHPIPPRGT
jgi:hypothetical protein